MHLTGGKNLWCKVDGSNPVKSLKQPHMVDKFIFFLNHKEVTSINFASSKQSQLSTSGEEILDHLMKLLNSQIFEKPGVVNIDFQLDKHVVNENYQETIQLPNKVREKCPEATDQIKMKQTDEHNVTDQVNNVELKGVNLQVKNESILPTIGGNDAKGREKLYETYDLDSISGEKNGSLKNSVIGVPDRLEAPPSVDFLVETDGKEVDLASSMKHSDPRLAPFLKQLIKTYPKAFPANRYDLGCFLNKNFKMKLYLKNNDPDLLPKHKPYPTNIYLKKACMRIVEGWERSGLVEPSEERHFASRLLIVKKNLNNTDQKAISDRLFNDHKVKIDPNDKNALFRVDPDLLRSSDIEKMYRVCLDAKNLNAVCTSAVPLMQNSLNTIFDLIFSLGSEGEGHKKLKLDRQTDLSSPREPLYKTYENWEPKPINPNLQKQMDDFLNNDTNFKDDKEELHMTSLDLRSAHNTVLMDEDSSRLLNVITPAYTFYKFNQCAYGLSNVSNFFNSAICKIFADLILKGYIYVYADDLLIVSRSTLKEHARLIAEIIKRMEQNGVKVGLNKSFFGVKRFKYLGFELDKKGIRLTEERTKGLVNFERPHTVKAVQRFLGALNYVSIFYPNMAEDTSPLSDLLRKNQKFKWGEDQERCFQKIKCKIKQGLELTYLENNGIAHLYVDSSNVAGGGVVFIENKAGEFKPIIFLSKKYNLQQVNLYSALELELLCLIYCLEKIKYLLDIIDLRVYTDAKSILFLLKSGNIGANPRLSRLTARLSLFPIKFQISYVNPKIPGLMLADTLSRQYENDDLKRNCTSKDLRKIKREHITHDLNGLYNFEELIEYVKNNPDCVPMIKDNDKPIFPYQKYLNEQRGFVHNIPEITDEIDLSQPNRFDVPIQEKSEENSDTETMGDKSRLIFDSTEFLSKKHLIKAQMKDDNLSKIIFSLKKENLNLNENLIVNEFTMKNGILFKLKEKDFPPEPNNLLLVIPEQLIMEIIGATHILHGHLGPKIIYGVLKNLYFHKSLRSKTFSLLSKCHTCLLAKHSTLRHNPIDPALVELEPMTSLSMDFFKMENYKGFTHILIVLDDFSHFTWLFPCKGEKAIQVKTHLENIFSLFGSPNQIRSDNGASLLRAGIVKDLLEKYHVQKSLLTLAYHPLHNSLVENRIKQVRSFFRAYERMSPNWVDLCKQIQLVSNLSPNKCVYDGKTVYLSPFEKFFLRQPQSIIPSAQNLLFNDSKMSKENRDELIKMVNKYSIQLREKYRQTHNEKAAEKDIKIGDFVLYKRLQPPGEGEKPLKYQTPYLKRLFFLRYMKGTVAEIEDVISGVVLKVSSYHIKKYRQREEIFDNLSPNLKKHLGGKFTLSLDTQTRQEIIQNVKRAGFQVDEWEKGNTKERHYETRGKGRKVQNRTIENISKPESISDETDKISVNTIFSSEGQTLSIGNDTGVVESYSNFSDKSKFNHLLGSAYKFLKRKK